MLLRMRAVAFVSTCLACAIQARRIHGTTQQMDPELRRASWHPPSGAIADAVSPVSEFASLLLALQQTLAFHPSGARMLRTLGKSALADSHNVAMRVKEPQVGRRALLGGLAAGAAGSVAFGAVRPAVALGLRSDLKANLERLDQAKDDISITKAYQDLKDVVESYGGIPSTELTKQVVDSMRAKRTALQGKDDSWNAICEEAYARTLRLIDPWRTVEIAPILERSIFFYPFAYIGLIFMQQGFQKYFNQAYAICVALLLGPIAYQLVIG